MTAKYRSRVPISAPDSIKMLFLLQRLLTHFQIRAIKRHEKLNGIGVLQIIRDSRTFFDFSNFEDELDPQRRFIIDVILHDSFLRGLYYDGPPDWFLRESVRVLRDVEDYLYGVTIIPPDVTLVKNLSQTVCDNSFYLTKKRQV